MEINNCQYPIDISTVSNNRGNEFDYEIIEHEKLIPRNQEHNEVDKLVKIVLIKVITAIETSDFIFG